MNHPIRQNRRPVSPNEARFQPSYNGLPRPSPTHIIRPETASEGHPTKAARRFSFTLVEMVTVLAMVTLVMTSVAVTISSLHRLNTKLRDEFPTSAAVAGLGMHLRSDAHAARQAALVTGSQGDSVMRLTMPDQRIIDYSASQARASRTVRHGDQIERNEVYVLPRGSELIWSVSDDAIPLVTLTIQRHVGKSPGAVDDLRETTITAAVGLDHATR